VTEQAAKDMAKPGRTVIWNDPDLGLCTGEYEVVDVNGEIYALKNKWGSEVECTCNELEIPEETSEK
jgi:hypothetical protein